MTVVRLHSFLLAILMSLSAVFGQAPDRSKPPAAAEPRSLQLPPLQKFTLRNGMQVVLLEKHTLPLAQIEILVRAGSALDPVDKPGLASLTSALMEEGAGNRNALEFADAVDYLGASISSFAGWHTSGVSLHTPVAQIDSALPLLADAVLRPLFPPEELERQRRDRLTTLQEWHDEPSAVASVLFQRLVFGETHPYGHSTHGTEKSIRSFTVEDVRRFHAAWFRPNNATAVVVGDVRADDIRARFERLFGGWEPGTLPAQSFPPSQGQQNITVALVDKPDAPQSEIIVGQLGLERATELYFPVQVMNTILGGSFTSRLNQNLREEHGYTYGAGSGFEFRLHRGPFSARAAVQTAVTDKSLSEIFKELKSIRDSLGDGELERARNYLTLRYPRNFESVEAIASRIADLVVYGLPDSYFNDYTSQVLRVKRSDALDAARRSIDPASMVVVIVGDRKQIEKGITDLHLGTLQTYTVDDVLGPAPVIDGPR